MTGLLSLLAEALTVEPVGRSQSFASTTRETATVVDGRSTPKPRQLGVVFAIMQFDNLTEENLTTMITCGDYSRRVID
jgi:hypothetical protein